MSESHDALRQRSERQLGDAQVAPGMGCTAAENGDGRCRAITHDAFLIAPRSSLSACAAGDRRANR